MCQWVAIDLFAQHNAQVEKHLIKSPTECKQIRGGVRKEYGLVQTEFLIVLVCLLDVYHDVTRKRNKHYLYYLLNKHYRRLKKS